MTDFDKAVEFVLSREGYRSELPGDPGGLTIWGISMAAHPAEVKVMDGLEPHEAKECAKSVYRRFYWTPSGCDSMSWPLNLVVFDTAVNCGRGRLKDFVKGVGSNWLAVLCNRVRWQLFVSKSVYTRGILNRIGELYLLAKGGE